MQNFLDYSQNYKIKRRESSFFIGKKKQIDATISFSSSSFFYSNLVSNFELLKNKLGFLLCYLAPNQQVKNNSINVKNSVPQKSTV